jgi:hypothetical protein
MVSTAELPFDNVRARAAIADFEAATLLARMRMEGMKAANRQHKLEKGTTLPFRRMEFAAVEAELIAAQERFRAEVGLPGTTG